MDKKIIILDLGVGNLNSVKNMIRKAGYNSILSKDINEVKKADKYILPGVGKFDFFVKKLLNEKFFSEFEQGVLYEGKPLLGICLGMQLLTKGSEEGDMPGLGWVDAEVTKIQSLSDEMRVPHMGWSSVSFNPKKSLSEGLLNKNKFYFAHSYIVSLKNNDDLLGETNYGTNFASAFAKKNIYGVQFHPEKSHKYGLSFLQNFCKL